jgi:hypothetical protein
VRDHALGKYLNYEDWLSVTSIHFNYKGELLGCFQVCITVDLINAGELYLLV